MSLTPPANFEVPWATSGLKNAIPANANPTTGNAGYAEGFPAVNMTPKVAGGIPPFGKDFNGILFDITKAIQYFQAGGFPIYSSSMSTAIGGYGVPAILVSSDGKSLYFNTVPGNTTNPDSGGAGWLKFGPGSYGDALIGVPIPWPLAVMPQDIWPDCGMIFLPSSGNSFNTSQYQKLAQAYPSGILKDLRAEFIRGWDNSRGVDVGRALLTNQDYAIQSHNHSWLHRSFSAVGSNSSPPGTESRGPGYSGSDLGGGSLLTGSSGGSETRPRNISFYYIVRAS